MAQEVDKARYFRDLLPLEKALVFGDAIGEVTEFPFHFTVHDPTPIRERPIAYAAP